MTIDVNALRMRFPTLAHKTYFQSGGYGLLSIEGQAALEQYIADRLNEGATWAEWGARTERIRGKFARLLGASPDEIAIVPSASAGINSIASAMNFDDGRDTVLVSGYEFPTSGQIWHAQESRGARVTHVHEGTDGTIPLERFAEAIDERTKIIAISDVCYRTGAKLDTAGIVHVAHEHGALVILDCFQSVGVQHLDVREVDVDFAVGGTQKYLLGSSGLGFLYVKSALTRALVATVSGWHAQANQGEMEVITTSRPRTRGVSSREHRRCPPSIPARKAST